MRAFFLIFAFILSSSCYSQLVLIPSSQKLYKRGEIIEAELRLTDKDLLEKLSPSAIQKSSIPEALWFMHVGPWQLSDKGLTTYTKIVFGKDMNPGESYNLEIAGNFVALDLEDWSLESAQKQQGQPLIYEDVPWYTRAWWEKNKLLLGLIIVGSVVGLALLILKIKNRSREKKRKKICCDQIIKSLKSADSFESISKIWLDRDILVNHFLEKELFIRDFFEVLNRYQFKPTQSEDELNIVLKARNKLIDELERRGDGV